VEQSFQDFGVEASILQGVNDVGYEQPTPIQREAIPLLIEGRDLLAQSQTGTGKTAAFAIPLLAKIDSADRAVQGLVLVPTRELAVQVASTVHKLGKHKNVADLPIYGGQPIDVQLRALRRGVQVVIGTPGRVMDHMRRGTLDLSRVSMVVLDEADQMLDMGFVDDIEVILDEVPEGRQISLFSATIPPRIRTLSQRYMRNPASISISREHLTVPEVEQRYVETVRNGKLDALTRILDMEQPESALVFARTKRETDELGESLSGRGYAAEVIHGDLSQSQRERAINAFKDKRIDVLVATDVAARGLDIPNVSHVINYDIPEDPEAYVHRIGRTARAGKAGKAITFVTPRERALLKTIERLIRVNLVRMRVPTLADIAERRAQAFRDSLREILVENHLEPYLVMVEQLGDEFDVSQIAAAAIKLALAEPIDGTEGDDGRSVEQGMERLFVRAGRRDGVSAKDFVGAIANEAGIPGREIGAIDVYDKFSFVEVPKSQARVVVEALSRSGVRGKRVPIDIAVPSQPRK
jgi:ATP-dependent RNA helicase DeaD